jgi:hypothetical protein
MQERDKSVDRLTEMPWVLVKRTLGSPKELREKARKLAIALWLYGRDERVEQRLRRLVDLGYLDAIPNRTQRMIGAIDMLRFFIVPAAADYYESKGINFRFHTLLRLLDDPASVIDPTGFNSTQDTIIGHVMQVVHANPKYDFQLLESFEGGMDELERQVEAVIDGTHPRAKSIRAIVEDPTYHERLLQHIREYKRNKSVDPLLRENVANDPELREVEQTFGTVPGAMRYFSRMPRTLRHGFRHLLAVREFPRHLH